MSSSAALRPLFAGQTLRRATTAAHDEVDSLFSRVVLTSPAGYCAFLSAQARAHLPLEAALDAAGAEQVIVDWPQRRRAALLRNDLADLGMGVTPGPALALDGTPAIAGTVYVLEGSRLGGAMLRESVSPDLPARFLAAPAAPGAWRTLLLGLDTLLADPVDLERAIAAARATFALFAEAGRAILEPAHG